VHERLQAGPLTVQAVQPDAVGTDPAVRCSDVARRSNVTPTPRRAGPDVLPDGHASRRTVRHPARGVPVPRRPAVRLLGAAAAAGAIGAVGVAGIAEAGALGLSRTRLHRQPPRLMTVVSSGHVMELEGTVTVTPAGCDGLLHVAGRHAALPGFRGAITAHRSVLLGPPMQHLRNRSTVRPYTITRGTRPDPGDELTVTRRPWGDLGDGLGLQTLVRHVDSPVGPLPMTELWTGIQPPSRAVVYVHGRGANRADGLWLAPTVTAAGWRCVLAGYRNDRDAPQTGRYLLGGEWEDLAAIITELRKDGVEQIVLAGWSMGANVVASYLRATEDPQIAGVVLDSPALDWDQVMRHVLRKHPAVRWAVPAMLHAAALIDRVDWASLNHMRDTAHLQQLPMLLFHGTADDVVPVAVSRHLARTGQEVTYLEFDGADHCDSVLYDPYRYLGALHTWLRQLLVTH
jgi:acetyl esterase/lipase